MSIYVCRLCFVCINTYFAFFSVSFTFTFIEHKNSVKGHGRVKHDQEKKLRCVP
jgi:hypothetical protein